MKKLVIMAGGFHPPHLGHMALYNAAKKQFPDADVYVAATNDTSKRPFPFEIKAKLAQLAGVDPGHFIQVKSPFRPEEITKAYNPDDTELIYVRSEKDIGESPKPGGVKKDGSPAYLQPFQNQSIQPMSKHAYIAYLPTVEFAGGITSATEIRNRWPDLSEEQKVQLVNTLYPKTKQNQRLAANVIKLLNLAIQGNNQGINESICAKHISPSGAETTMCPDDDDYEINYGKDSGIADFRKKQGLDVRTGKKIKENNDNTDYVQQITSEFIRKVQPMRSRITDRKAIIGLLDRFFDKFAIPEEYFDDVYHLAARRLESEQPVDEAAAANPLARLNKLHNKKQYQAALASFTNDFGDVEGKQMLDNYSATIDAINQRGGTVYRGVWVAPGKKPNIKQPGKHWTISVESAEEFLDSEHGVVGHADVKLAHDVEPVGYIIGATVGPNSITNKGVDIAYFTEELEVNLVNPASARIKIVKKLGEMVDEGVAESKKQSTQQKFEKHLARHGYDVAEKSKSWDQKIKDIDAQIAAWDAEMQRRKRENLPESIRRAIIEGGHSLDDFDYMAEKK